MTTIRRPRTSHTYMGRTIRRTSWVGSRRWYLPALHPTGIPMDEKECRQFDSLPDAKEAIREDVDRIMASAAEKIRDVEVRQ